MLFAFKRIISKQDNSAKKKLGNILVSFFTGLRTSKWGNKQLILICAGLLLLAQSPIYGAEKIRFNFGLLGFKLELEDLRYFAETGEVPQRLKFYLNRIDPTKRKELQNFIVQSYDVKPWLAYRFAHTSVGIKLLDRLGDFVQIPEDINGFHGIRAAILKTVTSSEENNLLNLLANFPTDIKLDLAEILELTREIRSTEQTSRDLVTSLATQTAQQQASSSEIIAGDLPIAGRFSVEQTTIEFYDQKRDRILISDLFLPETNKQNIPVVVVSNGLGARRTRFTELANYLAASGIAVLVPEHPGSNYQRQQEFIQGLHQENFAGADYLDRPLDVSFLLDELELLNQQALESKLDTSNVGIFGYSIGGTTALSLAGAEIDFTQLENNCNQELDLTNISVLYQCRALEIRDRTSEASSTENSNLKDARIKAAFLFVPFGESLFSPQSLQSVKIPDRKSVV